MRPARENEEPRFGQVWTWDEGEPPLMCIGPARPAFAGGRDGWNFLTLTDNPDISLWYWVGLDGRPFPEWRRLDDD